MDVMISIKISLSGPQKILKSICAIKLNMTPSHVEFSLSNTIATILVISITLYTIFCPWFVNSIVLKRNVNKSPFHNLNHYDIPPNRLSLVRQRYRHLESQVKVIAGCSSLCHWVELLSNSRSVSLSSLKFECQWHPSSMCICPFKSLTKIQKVSQNGKVGLVCLLVGEVDFWPEDPDLTLATHNIITHQRT